MTIQFTKNIFAGVVLVAVSGGVALANQPVAQIEVMSGKVMVNSGQGFTQILPKTLLSIGERILIGKNSSLTLNFPNDKCSVTYTAASVVVVPANAPCKVGDHIAAVDENFATPANGVAGVPVFTTFAGTSVPVSVGLGFSLTVAAFAGATQLFPVSAP